MKINLLSLPRLDDGMTPLSLHKSGDTLNINGSDYDLSVIPDGATLPDAATATGCEYFTGKIERIDGELELTLILPVPDDPTESQAFPDPIINPANGEVPLP